MAAAEDSVTSSGAPYSGTTRHGSCLCGSVRYSVDGPMRAVVACHCQQCRKQSGHFFAATDALDTDLTITDGGTLKWYAASSEAKRGFCSTCGSALFWKSNGSVKTSILAGSMDGETRLALDRHIFVANKGDYYDVADGLPSFDQDDGAVAKPEWS
ncbi:MAG: GFA family protein [Pseudomonadota bacterium]